jgi:hypothetical protein
MQVDELTDEFDARRSTGYLCAATAGNFEQVIELPILKFQAYPTLQINETLYFPSFISTELVIFPDT